VQVRIEVVALVDIFLDAVEVYIGLDHARNEGAFLPRRQLGVEQ